jgi:secreted PhoX family phosphatase
LRKLADASSTVDPENTVANPDNLVVLPDGHVVVGEDSDLHRPNMLWVYNPEPEGENALPVRKIQLAQSVSSP